MKKFVIKGPTKGVKGTIIISGAKNSCLPIMASSILFNKEITIKNIPLVNDVFTMRKLLISLGSNVEISKEKKTMKIINTKKHKLTVPYKLVSTMRAGVLTMGSLLGRYQNKKIYVAKSGGCSLGIRDINYHLAGFKSLSASNSLENGYVKLYSRKGLKGGFFKFPKVTVTGTSNLIMASIFAKGVQILENISIEPEVIDLINFLNNSGADIKFKRKRTIRIKGIKKLDYGSHEIIGDRIEAFSYLCVAAITKGQILLKNINPKHLLTELKALKKIGCYIKVSENSILLKSMKKHKAIKIETGPFPKYATDNMPMALALLTKTPGTSFISEKIFSNRFMAVPELNRIGAKITIENNNATVVGQKNLYGADCISSDLRTTFSIILGALAAKGTSKIHRIYHGLRGYDGLERKLKSLGVLIKSKN